MHLLQAGCSALIEVVFFTQIPDGVVQLVGILDERDDDPEREAAVGQHLAAGPEYGQDGEDAYRFDEGEVKRKVKDNLLKCLDISLVFFSELYNLPFLSVEGLRYIDAGQALLNKAVHLGDALSGRLEGLFEPLPEEMADDEEEQKEKEDHPGKGQIQIEHDAQNSDDGDDIAQGGYDARGYELIDVLDIIGHIVVALALGGLVEVRDRKVEDEAEDPQSHVSDDALTEQLGHVDLEIDGDIFGDDEKEIEEGHKGKASKVLSRYIPVDGDFQDVGRGHSGEGHAQHEQQRKKDDPLIFEDVVVEILEYTLVVTHYLASRKGASYRRLVPGPPGAGPDRPRSLQRGRSPDR